jgi:hypothetical protein
VKCPEDWEFSSCQEYIDLRYGTLRLSARRWATQMSTDAAILIMTNSCSIPEETSTVRTSEKPNRARTVETAQVV